MIRSFAFLRMGLLACMIGLLTGCNVGPKYVRPNVTAPPVFRGADDSAVSGDEAKSLGDEQWAVVYQEPELQALIRKALANNYDVRIAAQRILEQQAQVKITRSQQFPTVTNRYRRHYSFFVGHPDSQPAGGRVLQSFGRMDARLLGTVS